MEAHAKAILQPEAKFYLKLSSCMYFVKCIFLFNLNATWKKYILLFLEETVRFCAISNLLAFILQTVFRC